MAFRKKYEHIKTFKPDLLILQECEYQEKILASVPDLDPDQFFWHGDNKHKGIALMSFQNYKLSLNARYNPEFKYIIPYQCTISDQPINLFVIWAMPHRIKSKSYVGQIWNAIQYYEELLAHDSILIGDFNSHVMWDKERRPGNHSGVVNFLKERHILSAYHTVNDIKAGDEIDPTFYMYKNEIKPYHMDYCFASKSLLNNCQMTIGAFKDWISLSDHMPLFVDLHL